MDRDQRVKSRLNRLHPYPAMVADPLAMDLATTHVRQNIRILDPFCGSGRLLASNSHIPGHRVGVDVNPLACLITKTKLSSLDQDVVFDLAKESEKANRLSRSLKVVSFETNRKVDWFSQSALIEISQIVRWVNRLNLSSNNLVLAGSALSAAVREASYLRKNSWKLHRMSEEDRIDHCVSPWEVFSGRLRYVANELKERNDLKCKSSVYQSRFSDLIDSIASAPESEKFDLVMTSPPYGDSRTTVQYGAASELSLAFVSKIHGLEQYASTSRIIDRACLGGELDPSYDDGIREFWAGKRDSILGMRVASFLSDLQRTCKAISKVTKPDGTIIFIVARRSTGGYRLKIDEFVSRTFSNFGFRTKSIRSRQVRRKKIPQRINKFARSRDLERRKKGSNLTMGEEYILTMEGHRAA